MIVNPDTTEYLLPGMMGVKCPECGVLCPASIHIYFLENKWAVRCPVHGVSKIDPLPAKDVITRNPDDRPQFQRDGPLPRTVRCPKCGAESPVWGEYHRPKQLAGECKKHGTFKADWPEPDGVTLGR